MKTPLPAFRGALLLSLPVLLLLGHLSEGCSAAPDLDQTQPVLKSNKEVRVSRNFGAVWTTKKRTEAEEGKIDADPHIEILGFKTRQEAINAAFKDGRIVPAKSDEILPNSLEKPSGHCMPEGYIGIYESRLDGKTKYYNYVYKTKSNYTQTVRPTNFIEDQDDQGAADVDDFNPEGLVFDAVTIQEHQWGHKHIKAHHHLPHIHVRAAQIKLAATDNGFGLHKFLSWTPPDCKDFYYYPIPTVEDCGDPYETPIGEGNHERHRNNTDLPPQNNNG